MTDPNLDALFAPLEPDHGADTEMVLDRMAPHNFEAEAALPVETAAETVLRLRLLRQRR